MLEIANAEIIMTTRVRRSHAIPVATTTIKPRIKPTAITIV